MAIKRVTLNTLTFLVNEIKERYTEKQKLVRWGIWIKLRLSI